MENLKTTARGLHPLLVIAALAVIVFSIVGVAAIYGRIPGAESKTVEPQVKSTAAPSAPRATGAGPASAPRPAPALRAQAPAPCAECGVIESVRVVQAEGGTSGLGAAAGGVTGAIVGSQFGRGDGRTLATIAGAAGGAYAGNAIEKNMNKRTVVRVTLRMDDGTLRTLSQPEAPPFAAGDRVRIENGRIAGRA